MVAQHPFTLTCWRVIGVEAGFVKMTALSHPIR